VAGQIRLGAGAGVGDHGPEDRESRAGIVEDRKHVGVRNKPQARENERFEGWRRMADGIAEIGGRRIGADPAFALDVLQGAVQAAAAAAVVERSPRPGLAVAEEGEQQVEQPDGWTGSG
jgi:hypothetical protein